MVRKLSRFVLDSLNRDNIAAIFFHMAVQFVVFSIRGKFQFTTIAKCGWQKRSDRLFVIAAGTTVNEISEPQWREIEKDDIIALSYGSLVPARVDAVVAEYAIPELAPNQKALFIELSRRYGSSKNTPICIWKHPENTSNTELLKLRLVKVLTIVIPSLSSNALERTIQILSFFQIHKFFSLQAAGSISTLIMFGRAFGYKEVVLIGVDLSDRRYFFDENSAYDTVGLKNPFILENKNDLSRAHQVTDGYNDISNFAQRLRIVSGKNMDILVSSERSALSKYFPVYSFTSE